MEITLPTTTHKTITTSSGKEIRVITKTKFPKPAVDVILPPSCPSSQQRTWHEENPKEGTREPFDYEEFGQSMARQLASFKSKRNRGNHGKKT